VEHLKKHKKVVWRNSFSIHKGDIIYVYIGAPYGEIKYKCIVTNDTVDDSLLQKHSYAIVTKKYNNYFSKKIKYIEFELIQEFPDNVLSFSKLKEYGLGQVQIQARINKDVQHFIGIIEKELSKK
jgi:hypothetical protein